jgi:septal ring factor EnvC (AmiA/AmiB activator)
MKDKLEQRFRELDGQFDIEEPKLGHFDRFEVKLARQTTQKPKWNPNTWKWLAIAASIALLFTLGLGNYSTKQGLELADVSPKMEETQSFFVSTIQQEIENINLKRNDYNQQIIDDAFKQLNKLEENYKQLTVELDDSGKDKRIIYAMISNFQQRIEVLQSLLQQLDELQQLKNNINDEKII